MPEEHSDKKRISRRSLIKATGATFMLGSVSCQQTEQASQESAQDFYKEVTMDKVVGKDIPIEKQRDMLIEMNALKLPLLYQNLVAVYGEDKGRSVYDDVFEEGFKKRAKMFEGKDIGDIMMYEIDMFPATGWKIWREKQEENGEPVWYEHLERCPHLDATRKRELPDPCPIVCDMDCRLGQQYKVAQWERIKHLPAGDTECCFKIKRCT